MAHGYAKIEGTPLCVFAHGTVGLQELTDVYAFLQSRPRPAAVSNIPLLAR
jgi:hypothetical protein